MKPWRILVVVVLVVGSLGIGFSRRRPRTDQRPELAGAGTGSGPRGLPDGSPEDLFPLDGRVRVFETRQRHIGEGILVYETIAAGTERLSDGAEYRIVETRVKSHVTGGGRLVSREWLRREPLALLCGRREEGPVMSDLVPPQPLLVLPLEVGKSWPWQGLAGPRSCRMTSRVVARERVTVGAGTFDDAWRIDSEVTSDAGPDSVRRSLWLEPGLGLLEERTRITTSDRVVEIDAALRSVAISRQ